MLRAASIGLGWWSDELAKAIQGRSDKIQIASCYSRSGEKRSAFADRFGTDQHESYEAVLADPDIDAVILTTPHSLHAEHVIRAAAAGKQVFVEKPFTLTAETGRQAAAACATAGVVLAVGQNRRFSAVAAALMRMLDAGAFGTVLHAEANFSGMGALNYTPDRWRADRTESPGGGIAGMGVHLIDLMCALFGPVAKVNAQAKRRAAQVDIDDTTSALFDFASGPTGYLGTMAACPNTNSLNVYGTDANAFCLVDADQMSVQAPGERPEPRVLQPVDTLKAELEEFADAVDGSVTFRVRPDEAIHTVAVMQAMVASAAAGGAPIELADQE